MSRPYRTSNNRRPEGTEVALCHLLREVMRVNHLTAVQVGLMNKTHRSYVSAVARGGVTCSMRTFDRWFRSLGYTVEVRLAPIPGFARPTPPPRPKPGPKRFDLLDENDQEEL